MNWKLIGLLVGPIVVGGGIGWVAFRTDCAEKKDQAISCLIRLDLKEAANEYCQLRYKHDRPCHSDHKSLREFIDMKCPIPKECALND